VGAENSSEFIPIKEGFRSVVVIWFAYNFKVSLCFSGVHDESRLIVSRQSHGVRCRLFFVWSQRSICYRRLLGSLHFGAAATATAVSDRMTTSLLYWSRGGEPETSKKLRRTLFSARKNDGRVSVYVHRNSVCKVRIRCTHESAYVTYDPDHAHPRIILLRTQLDYQLDYERSTVRTALFVRTTLVIGY
jgi:hypothetical protein